MSYRVTTKSSSNSSALSWSTMLCLAFLSLGCLSAKKQVAQTEAPPDPVDREPQMQTVATEAEPESLADVEDDSVPLPTSDDPSLLANQGEPEDATAFQPDAHHHHAAGEGEPEESLTPRQMLEQALGAYQLSQEAWKSGELEAALSELDNAYTLILGIDERQNPEILQEKDDLRYLISRRVVEIYASRTTSVGDLKKSIPIVINEHVEREIRSFQTRERKFFLASYKRSGMYRPMVEKVLAENGMPQQLIWLALIESGFKTNALSRARALGLWQFIPSTGYRYGLERNRYIDERMDPIKATNSAIAYLQDLHNLFGDWLTALAAYNCGEGRVQRVINGQRLNYLDNFWDLYEQLPRETARYVPRFLATLAILEDPAKYGFDLPELDAPMNFEIVKVDRPLYLSEVERRLGLPAKSLKKLNPELRYGLTPDVTYNLRVPPTYAEQAVTALAEIPAGELPADAYVVHRVRRGESLYTIAKKYKTTIGRIVAANKMNNKNRIWPGQKLKVPGRGVKLPPPTVAASSGSWVTHKVRSGDNLWRLAGQYNTTIGKIKSWNKLSSSRLSLGQTLKIQQGSASKQYRVQRGDTMAKIAKKLGVSLTKLLRANNMSKRDKIYPNQALVVP
ncbi:LysM peptidoglycan-binding domain-containing protein [Sulfidibacter corallicola]|uniref:LysM peptidoglycan-binding domain-containing protein n=1 Tax=Sulfidibacter corallicola TaxID=2818388 RepID=A0A8A4TGL3_SULCO|nr:LysM peptidoglycan-binding domain-containing protein [Sulfidibacter corallicola]QTD49209.1 LysM peptidoglycan-binding domain-containing protein [Sulfidibacter corallicola]